jgi:tetratricopeptide (TPR) repeat protein
MKSWFVSSLLLLCAGLAQAASPREGFVCLKEGDLTCARRVVDELSAEGDRSPETELLAGRVLFHEGDAAGAAAKLRALAPRASQLKLDQLAGTPPRDPYVGAEPTADLAAGLAGEQRFYAATAEVHASLIVTRVGDVEIRHHPGVERVLVEEAVEALNLARARIAPRLGGDVPGLVRLELYPDGQSFITASGLPEDAVRTTGVVAISKWNRLLVTSPRVRGGGYDWKDTVVHEWIHGVVSYHSKDEAPVWLQEGIAKSMDMLWREDNFTLEVRSQSLLAGAIQSGEWVTFDQMHPSMALLPTADMAGLAYAQVATMMEHLQLTTDRQALVRVLKRVRGGEDARQAVAEVANGGDFGAFETSWRAYLKTLNLVGVKVAATPTTLDGEESDFAGDPVLARRQDLANLTRLGELMAERGHYDAALVYYERAVPQDEPPGPLLTLLRAEALAQKGQADLAISLLRENLVYYPSAAKNQRLLGELLLAQDEDAGALRAFRAAADVNPFDPALHEQLAALYRAQGRAELAARHERALVILRYQDAPAGARATR